MNKSDKIDNLAKALVEVQKTELFALTDKENPFFKSKYADLSSVWSAARKPLTDNGLSVVQTMDESDNGVIIETTLLHTSGEYISGRLLIAPEKKTPQGIGSAITYGRRYALAAIIGISPEDDDAESAMDRDKKVKATGEQKKQPEKKQPTVQTDKELSKAQWKYIVDTGKKKDLTEPEVIKLVKWVAKQNNISPRNWEISKLLLPIKNFELQLDKYLEGISQDDTTATQEPTQEKPIANHAPEAAGDDIPPISAYEEGK